ncbi:MAG: phospholipase D-like domain-containing protein [Turicibacter sp.]|nr:phospholipase D-like domain-containing protein [Turicibacter sp.]
MSALIKDLELSLRQGFIDKNIPHLGNFKPRLLVNNKDKNEYVLTSLIEELETCETFFFSVAFITESGLAMFKSHLLDLKEKGIKGRIITSNYLNFNKPKIFHELLKLTNVEVRIADVKGFHSKGYIFKHIEHYSLIVGSSNLTQDALKANHEWNIQLTSHENGEIVDHFNNQFEEMWEMSYPLNQEWIGAYEKIYVPISRNSQVLEIQEIQPLYQVNAMKDALKIKPNKMQQSALAGIASVRDSGQERALIISATGTGKTYLSAFEIRAYQPKRMLFIVHREPRRIYEGNILVIK